MKFQTQSHQKIILIFLTLFSLAVHATEKPLEFSISSSVLKNSQMPFIKHTADRAFGSYLTMNIRYQPVKTLLDGFEGFLGRKLKNRGEAHVTTITPPEFDKILKPFVSIEEIHQIAEDMDIQSSDLKIDCLGRGTVGDQQTFFVVVKSENLLKIRQAISQLFLSKGGPEGQFFPEKFYPHITLGFTHRDLHFSDGIRKDCTHSRYSRLVVRDQRQGQN